MRQQKQKKSIAKQASLTKKTQNWLFVWKLFNEEKWNKFNPKPLQHWLLLKLFEAVSSYIEDDIICVW